MEKILEYILGLDYFEKPNYLMIIKTIEMILNKLNLSNDLQFDWYSLDFLNFLYYSFNNDENDTCEENNKKENKSQKEKVKENEKTNGVCRIDYLVNEKTNEILKLSTINNDDKLFKNYNAKKLKNSYIKNYPKVNNSYIRSKNNQLIQERSKSLTVLKKLYCQRLAKNNNNENKNNKLLFDSKNRKEKQNKEIFKGKENIKIKNIRIKK